MADLIYSAIASLDGYIADEAGQFGWAEPDEQVHSYINSRQRSIGTYLFGRRMYEVMQAWESMGEIADLPPVYREFADVWKSIDKVVYSTMLPEVGTARTRLERSFEPEAVSELKATSDRDLSIAGPTLAAKAFRADLIDVVHLYLVPVIVGGGTAALPPGVRLDLDLVEEHRFDSGVVHLSYRTRG